MNTLNVPSAPGMSGELWLWILGLAFLTLLALTLVMIFAPRRRTLPKPARPLPVVKAAEPAIPPSPASTDIEEVIVPPMEDELSDNAAETAPVVEPLKAVLDDEKGDASPTPDLLVNPTSGLSLIMTDGYEILLPALPMLIGRSPECSVRVNDESVSARHAEIFYDSDSAEIFIRDLDSLNGIWVNDQPTTWNVLQDGDSIALGALRITFHNRGYTPPVGD